MKMKLELGNLMPSLDAKVRDGVHKACKEEGLDTDKAFVERSVVSEKARTNQLDEGSRAAVKYVSRRTCDAEGDLVNPRGIELKEFLKNPVFFWGHNYSLPPLGSDEAVDIDEHGLKVKSIYGDTGPGTMAEVVWRLVQQGHQKQSSIGYVPLRSTKRNDNNFDRELGVYQKQWPELGDGHNVKRLLHKVLMLEHSDVGLGMNRDTTVLQVAKGYGASDMLFKQMGWDVKATVDGMSTDESPEEDGDEAAGKVAMVCPECGAKAKGKPGMLCPKCQKVMKPVKEEETDETAAKAGPIPYTKAKPAPIEMPWEVKELAKEGYTWFGGDPEMKASFKLPHHNAEGLVVWNGLREAMGLLLGARGGVDIPAQDRGECWKHLAWHYQEFNQAAPELKDYTQGELREAFPELYKSAYARPIYIAKPFVKRVELVREVKHMSVGAMVEAALAKKMGRI